MDVAIGLPNAVPRTSGEQLTGWARRAEARGFGLGGREDDYEIAGVDTSTRGRDLDAMLERIREVWKGEEMGPEHPVDPRILVGGSVEAFKCAARFGDGWIAAGAPPQQFAEWRAGFEAAWNDAGRSEEPRNAALAYFSLGDNAEEDAKAYLTHYYAWLGQDVANFIADAAGL